MTDLPSKIGMVMSEGAIRSFLESKEHGVLSMGADNRGYGHPVSFRYDEENDRIILGLVNAPGSKKQRFATATEEVTLTVFDYEDVDSWMSVIVTGTIHQLSEADVPDQFATLFYFQEDDATGERRMVDLDEFERVWYELRVGDISGRYSGQASQK